MRKEIDVDYILPECGTKIDVRGFEQVYATELAYINFTSRYPKIEYEVKLESEWVSLDNMSVKYPANTVFMWGTWGGERIFKFPLGKVVAFIREESKETIGNIPVRCEHA